MSLKSKNEKKNTANDKISPRDIEGQLAESIEIQVPRTQIEIPASIDPNIKAFSTLRTIARLIEHHYDSYTDAEEKKLSSNVLSKLTEINVSGLTQGLNDVQKSQAAMLIRQIIQDHPLLKKVDLHNNDFAAPDLQFIINSLMYVKYKPVQKYNMNEVNLDKSVTAINLERSGDTLIQLKKIYGDDVTLDASVYDHFIERYTNSCSHYSLYLAKKIILPKAGVEAEGTPEDILTAADSVVKKGLPAGTKNVLRFELAAKKFVALRELSAILTSQEKTQEKFDRFQTQYKNSKKAIAKSINKDDDAHLERFYEKIGDVKPKVFTASNNPSTPIFKAPPTKKKKGKKAKAAVKKPAAKKGAKKRAPEKALD